MQPKSNRNRMFRCFSSHRECLSLKVRSQEAVRSGDVLRLNKEALSERDYKDTSSPRVLPIAVAPGSLEVNRLEIRRGFARAYDCLVEDPAERGRGFIVAREYFPDEILD